MQLLAKHRKVHSDGMLQPDMLVAAERSGKGAAYYNLHQLFHFVRASTTLRNSSKMGDALQNWLHLFFGSKDEVAVINDKVKCPSGGTISRARPKVDVGLMLMRRKFWKENWQNTSIQLGYDATTMAKELMVAEEHTIQLAPAETAFLQRHQCLEKQRLRAIERAQRAKVHSASTQSRWTAPYPALGGTELNLGAMPSLDVQMLLDDDAVSMCLSMCSLKPANVPQVMLECDDVNLALVAPAEPASLPSVGEVVQVMGCEISDSLASQEAENYVAGSSKEWNSA
ncbi:unnamed protein product, partial [Cladocopium goreaui]